MVASAEPGEAATGGAAGKDAPAEPLSDEVVQEMKLAFAAFDVDGSGVIDTKELGEAMRRLGLSKDDARAAMLRVDADSDGSISFSEFCTAMAPMYSQNTQMLRRAFRFFDADNSGFIDREELRAMLSKLRMAPPNEAALEAAFQAADTNGDNQISFSEFINILSPGSNANLERQVRSASR
jgi:Ca2+-binding EF-hand superfamily protein